MLQGRSVFARRCILCPVVSRSKLTLSPLSTSSPFGSKSLLLKRKRPRPPALNAGCEENQAFASRGTPKLRPAGTVARTPSNTAAPATPESAGGKTVLRQDAQRETGYLRRDSGSKAPGPAARRRDSLPCGVCLLSRSQAAAGPERGAPVPSAVAPSAILAIVWKYPSAKATEYVEFADNLLSIARNPQRTARKLEPRPAGKHRIHRSDHHRFAQHHRNFASQNRSSVSAICAQKGLFRGPGGPQRRMKSPRQ